MEGASSTRRSLAALALAAAAGLGGCSGFHGTTAASFLHNIRESADPNVRYASYAKLGSAQCYDSAEQKAEAARTLITKLNEGTEPVATRAVICRTLGELGDPAAREAVIKAVADTEAMVRVQACRALGRVGRPEDATILARIMATDILDCRVAAIEGLAELKTTDPRIMQVLVAGMENDDPAIRLASLETLRAITRKDVGVEPAAWRKLLEPKSDPSAARVASAPAPAARGTTAAPAAR